MATSTYHNTIAPSPFPLDLPVPRCTFPHSPRASKPQPKRKNAWDIRRLKDEDTIYTERVEGYSKSLKDDALLEVREREEEAERARLAEEERLVQEALEAKQREDVERCVQ